MKKIAIVGVPYDRKSSFLQGAALAPGRIREALHNGSTNYFTETGINLDQHNMLIDKGNLVIRDYFDIEAGIESLLEKDLRTLALGGDHSVTYPILRAQRRHFQTIQILHIDAHGDLYDEFEGDRFSHACPFARIMEEGLADRLVQVGIRAMTEHQREQAARFGVEVLEMRHFHQSLLPIFDGPVYISLDLDGLDPAFAPGVSHHEPGGLTSREVLRMIQGLRVPIIGADIVELNPHRDHQGMTATLAAKLLKEIAGMMILNG